MDIEAEEVDGLVKAQPLPLRWAGDAGGHGWLTGGCGRDGAHHLLDWEAGLRHTGPQD